MVFLMLGNDSSVWSCVRIYFTDTHQLFSEVEPDHRSNRRLTQNNKF